MEADEGASFLNARASQAALIRHGRVRGRRRRVRAMASWSPDEERSAAPRRLIRPGSLTGTDTSELSLGVAG